MEEWDEKLRKHRDRMQKLGIGTSTSTGSIPQSVSSRPPPDVVLSTRTSNVLVSLIISDDLNSVTVCSVLTPPAIHDKLSYQRLYSYLSAYNKASVRDF